MNKKNILKILFIIILLTETKGIVFAETNKHLDVIPCYNNSANNIDKKATPYCAINQSGLQNNWDWKWESSMGALLNSLNNLSGYSDNGTYYYWNWSLNSNAEFSALNKYELKPNDIITLTFTNSSDLVAPKNDTTINFIIDSIRSDISTGGGPLLVSPVFKPIFDLKKAFDFIILEQKKDGSWGENIYTDWVALSLASTKDYLSQKTKLIKYFSENKLKSNLLTDYERHSMALMALGLDPYNTNGENYIQKIINSFDGKQFGDINEDNDDIFALIVLQNAGYTKDEDIIKNSIAFILSKQKENGSWNENVDMTGAGIGALSIFKDQKEVKNALNKAKNYLKQNQNNDGGWNNISSTSWAIEGILSLGEKPENWIKKRNRDNTENNPIDYLAENQETNGGMKKENLIWETAYVATALSEKTWNQLMQKFEKPQEENKIENKNDKITNKKLNFKKIKKENTPEIKKEDNINTKIIKTETIPEKKSYFKNLWNNLLKLF